MDEAGTDITGEHRRPVWMEGIHGDTTDRVGGFRKLLDESNRVDDDAVPSRGDGACHGLLVLHGDTSDEIVLPEDQVVGEVGGIASHRPYDVKAESQPLEQFVTQHTRGPKYKHPHSLNPFPIVIFRQSNRFESAWDGEDEGLPSGELSLGQSYFRSET